MDWNEAIEDAKRNLGCSGYIEDWDEVVQEAREILENERSRDYEEFCEDAYAFHKYYLASDKWKIVRKKVLDRDNGNCVDCEGIAVDVHHLDYDFMNKKGEEDYCVSLCRTCHKKRHGIIKSWQNSHYKQYRWEYA